MQKTVVTDNQPQDVLHKFVKRILWGLALVALILLAVFYFAPLCRFYYVPEELPQYTVRTIHQDDTLRIAIIGDSWADYHTHLSGDTIMVNAAKKISRTPVKVETRGKQGALSKEIYFFMYSDKTVEHSYEPDRCTQPLIEQHPDYCVIFAGINDVSYLRTTEYYAENMRLIIRLLLHNNIRPVVMEIPIVDFTEAVGRKSIKTQLFYKTRSIVMGTANNKGSDYRKALTEMLANTRLQDSVLYITSKQWNPAGCLDTTMFLADRLHLNLNGYRLLDSCIISEIIRDYEN
jgi:lysophospholipase L1-like esterase